MIDKLSGSKPSIPLTKDAVVEKNNGSTSSTGVSSLIGSPSDGGSKSSPISTNKTDQFVLSGGAKALANTNTNTLDNSAKIAKLKEQIANGSYKVDPQAIAKGILQEIVSSFDK